LLEERELKLAGLRRALKEVEERACKSGGEMRR
jgi:hypothetical protein